MKLVLATALFCAFTSVTVADGLPDLTIPNGVGVNIHFTTGHEQDLDLIQAAGFKWVRMDFLWEGIEHPQGHYDWSDYDAFTTELAQHGLRAYYILDYSSPLYEPQVAVTNSSTKAEEHVTASPQQPESIAAFARWAAAAARHFSGRGVAWEIWNEPNGTTFWRPKPDATQYIALALATAKAMRAADPHACILAPTTYGFPWPYLETVLQSGLLQYLDGVSVHPYRGRPPETAATDFARLRELIQRYAPAGKSIPIVSGEWGYSAGTKGISEDTQAAYIQRQQLSNLLNGVPLSIWYDWKNDGENPTNKEYNFGTVRPDLQPKPSYLAIQKLTRELSGYRLAGRRDTGNTNDFVLSFTNNLGQTKLAAWTKTAPHAVTLDSQLNLQLDISPKYVTPGQSN